MRHQAHRGDTATATPGVAPCFLLAISAFLASGLRMRHWKAAADYRGQLWHRRPKFSGVLKSLFCRLSGSSTPSALRQARGDASLRRLVTDMGAPID